MYWKLLNHMNLIGTGCVSAHALRVGCGFLEARAQKAAVQFLSEMAKSASCPWTISRSALRLAVNLVVSLSLIYS